MPRKKTTALKGDLSLLSRDQGSFTELQVQLLVAVDDCGSISAAARKIGISYKTAWDRIDAMNNMSDKPLLLRSAGGSHGGGTRLTEVGQEIVQGFQVLQNEHKAFVRQLGEKLHTISDLASFIKNTTLISSARNQYLGKVVAITRGAVNSEIELCISDSVTLIAHITNDSLKDMKLKKGSACIALIKSSWILLSKDIELKTSARNQLLGKVAKILKGQVNSEVILDMGDEKSICAIITNISVDELGLKKGDDACALFKASSVILLKA